MYKYTCHILSLFILILLLPIGARGNISRGDAYDEPRLFLKMVLSKDTIYTGDKIRATLYLYSNYELADVSYKSEVRYPKDLAVVSHDAMRRVGVDNVDGRYFYVYRLKVYDIKANNNGTYKISSPEVEATYLTSQVIYDGFMPYRRSQPNQITVKGSTIKLVVKKGSNPEVDRRRFPTSTAWMPLLLDGVLTNNEMI